MWKKVLLGVTIILTTLHIGLASFSLLHGEVNLFNDVARDFLLYREISEKTLVFIGPRSNIAGLYHGPLWSYLNYPTFLLGQGNPVVQGWFWILLTILMVALGFFIAKKLFGLVPACLYAILLSGNMIFRNNDAFFHGHATVFLSGAYYYTLLRYCQSAQWKFLLLNIIVCALMVQFMLAMLPLFGITFVVTAIVIIRRRLFRHWFTFIIVPLLLVNFVIFDFRHDHQMAKALFDYALSPKAQPPANFVSQRVNQIMNLQLGWWLPSQLVFGLFITTLLGALFQIKTLVKSRIPHLLFALCYFGFMGSTFFNKGTLLYHYYFPMMPLTTLWFVSLAQGRLKKLVIGLTIILVALNLQGSTVYLQRLQKDFFFKDPNSWLGLSQVAKSVLTGQEGKEFGYFVYSPDAFAYQPRYAMIYNFETAGNFGREYTKLPTTYVIAQQPPVDNPYMGYQWWIENMVRIKQPPVSTKTFPNGYTLLRYNLSVEEMKIPHDKNIELGIFFR